uniref:RNase H type-1 domain-containing protein n=1 Tax=Opuntia streptacantha TaxID=393608 RepID=A0A7C9AZV2_OPUST
MCIPKLWIRIDSKAVVTMLNNHNSEHLEHYFLIQQCKKLLDWGGWEVRISHCFREANEVADKLAKIGTEGRLGVTSFRAPPPETQEAMYADSVGVSCPRRCNY